MGRQNHFRRKRRCTASIGGAASCCNARSDAADFDWPGPGSTRPRPRPGPSSFSSPLTRSGASPRSAPTVASAVPVHRRCFSEQARRNARQPISSSSTTPCTSPISACARRPTRRSFPSTRPSSSTKPTGWRTRPRRLGVVSTYGLARLEKDVGRACLEAGVPVPVKALDRVRRAGGALIRSVAPASGRRRLREPPLAKGRVLVDGFPSWLHRCWAQTTSSISWRYAHAEPRGTRRHVSTPTSSTGSSGPSRTASAGRPWMCPGGCARRSGKAARPRFSSPPR